MKSPAPARRAATLRSLVLIPAAAVLLVPVTAVAQPHDMSTMAPPPAAPLHLFTDLGSWTHPVTATPDAQKYFDQGLRLYYGFNHAEAIRSFREAARLDPGCAMAWWGVAVSSGPNINLPMDADGAKIAMEAIAQANIGLSRASAVEKDWIAALSTRYSADPKASRAGLDSAYCDAMRKLAAKYPDDADASALFAESILDLNPWNQWTHEGAPTPGTLEAVATLERVLKVHPEHPGANHFYIHTVEASNDPGRALASAQRLETLMPGAGHLVHMPSHIYARTGRYADALERNRVAVSVDEKYIAAEKPEGIYPLMYYGHNIQFIWFTAMMQGRSEESLAAARKMTGVIPGEMIAQMPMLELVPPYPVLTLIRFGKWDEALQEPMPPASQRYASALFHYARGVADAGLAKFDAAAAELDSVRAASAATPSDFLISINHAGQLLRIADHALAGEIATRRGQKADGVRELRLAVATEDSLHYDEPPTWAYPVRHLLGAALLKSGRAAEAALVYRDDLKRHPENGWSLTGLAAALRAQGRAQEARTIDARLAKAWTSADVKVSASSY